MKSCLIAFLLLFAIRGAGQNLVPNPSFERLTACPDNYFQIYKAAPWFSPDCGTQFPDHGYAVLFNGCNYSFAGVPVNNMCNQTAHTGTSYAGIEVFSSLGRNAHTYRQYVEAPFITPLVAGKKYYFSMYFNLCDRIPGLAGLCFRSDSLGVVFTQNKIDKNPVCQVLPFTPDIHSELPPIIPGTGWHKIDGCYVANGGEQYLTIGNYALEKFSNCGTVDTLAHFIYVDDVSMIQEVDKKTDTILCPDTSWEIDVLKLRKEYETMEGWSFRWSDGDDASKRRIDRNTTIGLTATMKGCFVDRYEFKVVFDPACECQVFAPNAFTPNGDGLNDFFLPQIRCKSIDVLNYNLRVYNRWGQQVFQANDKTKSWDGKVRNFDHSTEVFYWMITYDVNRGVGVEHKSFSGTVTAIR